MILLMEMHKKITQSIEVLNQCCKIIEYIKVTILYNLGCPNKEEFYQGDF